MRIIIGHLYGDLMNIYGDNGNILCLKKRCQWREIEVEIKNISVGNRLKAGECDLYFFGGGQDQAQELVARDLKSDGKEEVIKQEIERGIPLLAICGGYQLLGEYYKPYKGPRLLGVGLFPVCTMGGNKRMIGNVIIRSEKFGIQSWIKTTSEQPSTSYLVGFENHSGQTFLKHGAQPLGKVIKGFGNNGQDKSEGCIYKNAIGCYLHGPLLPKNPKLADCLIQKALEIKYGTKIRLKPIDDELENITHNYILSRFM